MPPDPQDPYTYPDSTVLRNKFDTLTADKLTPRLVCSALTIVNCIGFSITIVSIALLSWLIETAGPQYVFLMLVPGPGLGLAALRRLTAKPAWGAT